MYRILITDKLGDAGLERLGRVVDATYDMQTALSKPELLETIGKYDALIVRSGTIVDAAVLSAGKLLKVVGRAGIGVDNIDVDAATRLGIVVMNTPHANAIATAEFTIALMLAASRNVGQSDASLRAGEWRRADFVGQQLYCKRLGIIGLGYIGRLVARRALGFEMEVVAYDPYVSSEAAENIGVSMVGLDALLHESDYISLHAVVTPETLRMIDSDAIAKMKNGVVLVNAARGKLIDDQALVDGLESGKIGGAAIDVYTSEPPADNPLIGHPRVIHTPHLGASTREAQRDVAVQIVDQVIDALRDGKYQNAINPP